LIAAPSALGVENVGYVFEVRGEWTLNGDSRELLRTGQELPAGGVIRNRSGDASDRIAVAGRAGLIIDNRSCGGGHCGSPIRLPRASRHEPTLMSVLMDTAMKLLRSDPERYRVYIIRGVTLQEAVARLADDRLDLSAVFAKAGAGTYHLRLTPLSEKVEAGREPLPQVVFAWDPARPSPLPARGLHPGLYELTLLKDDGLGPTPVTAWFFALGAGDFKDAAASFAEARRLTLRMGRGVSRQAARSFERAWLDHLSKKAPK
jgi:hypothetical protein